MFESVQPGNIGTPQYRKCADVVWPNFLEFLPLSPTDAPGRIDLRTAPQPDALIDLAARALSERQLPTESGKRPQDVLTINPPVLQGRIGTAQLAFGGPINTDTTRRLARDAGLSQ
ncbi:MAG TPA: hypothetical protein VGP04_08675 [Pseudonocardiaceae bacterium]|nr:hypothetical protein [Pseudonocardiaceae bacterium]